MKKEYDISDFLTPEQMKALNDEFPHSATYKKIIAAYLPNGSPLVNAANKIPDPNKFVSPTPVGSRFRTDASIELARQAMKMIADSKKDSKSA